MQYFWSAAFIAALGIGAITWGLMFWSFAFYRKKKGSPLYPKQTKENLSLELIYTAVPLVLGVVIVALVTSLPLVGWVFGLAIMLLGLGAFWIWGRETWQTRTVA